MRKFTEQGSMQNENKDAVDARDDVVKLTQHDVLHNFCDRSRTKVSWLKHP